MHRIVNNTIQLSTLFDEDPDQAMALNGSETRSSCNVFNFPDLTMLNNQTKTLKISGFIYRVSHFRPRTLEVDFLDGFLNAHNTHRSSVSSISVTTSWTHSMQTVFWVIQFLYFYVLFIWLHFILFLIMECLYVKFVLVILH